MVLGSARTFVGELDSEHRNRRRLRDPGATSPSSRSGEARPEPLRRPILAFDDVPGAAIAASTARKSCARVRTLRQEGRARRPRPRSVTHDPHERLTARCDQSTRRTTRRCGGVKTGQWSTSCRGQGQGARGKVSGYGMSDRQQQQFSTMLEFSGGTKQSMRKPRTAR